MFLHDGRERHIQLLAKSDRLPRTTVPLGRSARVVGKLFFMGHALMEYWHGLVVQADATETNGTVERKAALEAWSKFVLAAAESRSMEGNVIALGRMG